MTGKRTLDRRVRKTRRLLRQALTTLLVQKPIQEITVSELAELVDINRGTFYLHYKHINDMLAQIEQELYRDLQGIITNYPPQMLRENPEKLLICLFDFIQQNADIYAALLGPHGDMAFIGSTIELVRQHLIPYWASICAEESLEELELRFSFMSYGYIGLFKSWLAGGMQKTPLEMAVLSTQILTGAKTAA